ncbi:hypothetical protein M0E87_05830 [Corynebacterium sp. CCM 9185]|uniref:Uncharacterized protein n=1 Tax=Corynebacterium marambiense TaxID=2765364 RepID=A0ABS0VUW0_9CORY|nr:hypothetical protein [Corynebacterium marambiense]MBI9000556.1 hypothetical protein [Corynebacterium marambiense]MCK7663181.1 hypothetical protein [Corynebacterium marambiense]MCX7542795.1 hypothetical protein [Corynebacterium marambiense]
MTRGRRSGNGPWFGHFLIALFVPVGFLLVVFLSGFNPQERLFAELSYLTLATIALVVNAVVYARHLERFDTIRPPAWMTVTFACYHLAVLPLLIFGVVMFVSSIF